VASHAQPEGFSRRPGRPSPATRVRARIGPLRSESISQAAPNWRDWPQAGCAHGSGRPTNKPRGPEQPPWGSGGSPVGRTTFRRRCGPRRALGCQAPCGKWPRGNDRRAIPYLPEGSAPPPSGKVCKTFIRLFDFDPTPPTKWTAGTEISAAKCTLACKRLPAQIQSCDRGRWNIVRSSSRRIRCAVADS